MTAATFGAYDVRAAIARGGTSRVMLATHAATGAKVAVKALLPELAECAELRARLVAEKTLVARAAHPGLVEIFAAETAADGTPYLVMEYLDGVPLSSLVATGRMDALMAMAIGAQVAEALAALHGTGVVHCDVKSDNVIVLDQRDGNWPTVKVIDFGVARPVRNRMARGSSPAIEIEEPVIAGTPWCMAPEQWQGRPETASDVYSLGCVMFDLLTGHPPFEGTVPELMTAHMEGRPGALDRVPSALARLVGRMMAKDPAARPSMATVSEQLWAMVAMSTVEIRCAG